MRKFKWICLFGTAALCGCEMLDPTTAANIQEGLNNAGDVVAKVPIPYAEYLKMALTFAATLVPLFVVKKAGDVVVKKIKNSEPGKLFGPKE